MSNAAAHAPRRSAPWLPALAVGLVTLVASVLMWRALSTQETERLRATVDAHVLAFSTELHDRLGSRVSALERMGVRWEARSGTPEAEWRRDAGQYARDQRELQAVGWVDASLHVRWVEPLLGNEAAVGFNVGKEERRRRALEQAKELRQVHATQSIDLVQGGKGFLVDVPLFPEGRFDGFIAGVYRFQTLLDALAPTALREQYVIGLWEGSTLLVGPSDSASRQWSAPGPVRLAGAEWELRVSPKPHALAASRSNLPELTLFGGALLALLLSFSVRLWSTTRVRAEEAESAQTQLEQEISRRAVVEQQLEALAQDLEARVLERTRDLEDSRAVAMSLERELAQTQRLDAVGRLAGGVAHDFNNSLMAISGLSELALTRLEEDHPARRLIDKVTTAAERAARLTQQILAIGRRQVLQPKVIDLCAFVRRREEMLAEVLGPGVSLKLKLPEEPAWVDVDAAQLEQVLLDLTLNAREALGESGRVSVRIERRTLASGAGARGRILLEIRDNGEGMAEDTRARAFEPFFTTRSESTGLGLAMVHGFVTQSGGTIDLESQPGQGTTLRIGLRAAAPPLEQPEELVEAKVGATRGGTVLLVEDDPMVRRILKLMLESEGYTVLVAHDGQEGIERFDGHRADIDLVLTDVMMPRVSGAELARHINRVDPTMPVIFISGYTEQRLGENGIVTEAVTLLQKPVSKHELIATVSAALSDAA